MPLTESQIFHNKLFDLEIEQSEREFQSREEQARIKNEWFRKTYPDVPEYIAKHYGMNMVGRKKVIGLRYVE